MEKPFSDLLESFHSLFHLEAIRNGRYAYPEVQQLKTALENYNSDQKNTFIFLLKSIKEAMPYIEKWRVNFNTIKKSLDEMSKIHEMSDINWIKILSHPKISSRFQFNALNDATKDVELSSWITTKTGKSFFQMESDELTKTLINNKNRPGFSQKLSAYLKKYPDFLFYLIMDSEKNFIKICHGRLILYLTDQQIAKAIIKHLSIFVPKHSKPYEQVAQLINTFNYILSNGRSISTLLRNAEAKPILLNSIYFQIHQSDEFSKREIQPQESTTELKVNTVKPNF